MLNEKTEVKGQEMEQNSSECGHVRRNCVR